VYDLALCCAERRQTMLFSATNTQKTQALTRLALKKEPIYVGVDDETDKATVEGLEQGLLVATNRTYRDCCCCSLVS
jgi:superfamily II DNA/RNA helicase